MPTPLSTPYTVSAGEQTNPTTTTNMADTGGLPPGVYEVLVAASASANAQFQFQHRQTRNADNLLAFQIYVPANNPAEHRYILNVVEQGERFRVLMDDNLTGTATVVISAVQIR